MKTCIRCQEEKDESLFTIDRTIKSGIKATCRKCSCYLVKQRYRLKNMDKVRNLTQKRRNKDPRIMMIARAKQRAREKNLPFDLAICDIAIPEFCPILGIKLECGTRKFYDNAPSLDRIKPELGYVRGNVNVISSRANKLRNNGTLDELKRIVEYVSSFVN